MCQARLSACRDVCGNAICDMLTSACHDVDHGDDELHECHEAGHEGEIESCFSKGAHCLQLCKEAAH